MESIRVEVLNNVKLAGAFQVTKEQMQAIWEINE